MAREKVHESRVAWLFPGQGSEAPRMGIEVAARSERARLLLERVADRTRVDVTELLHRGGTDWERTEVMQPLLVAVSLGPAGELERAGLGPQVVAGHSLGELPAWSAAGCVDAELAVDLAALRGRLMAREAALHPGGMLALVGCDEATALAALALGATRGRVTLAARNAPDEYVLSGEESALSAIASAFTSRRLPVRGAWHGPAMAAAVDELRRALHDAPHEPPRASFVANRNGAAIDHDTSIPDLLAEQLCRPIEWCRTLHTLAELGVTDVVTLGPGRVLRALVRKNLGKRMLVHSTDSARELDLTIEALAS